MHSRCKGLHGGKYLELGIEVCTEWRTLKGFIRDMGYCPDGLSLDRIRNEEGYHKDNCRWVSLQEQAANRSTSVFITINGETMCRTEWARRNGIPEKTAYNRVKRGWDEQRAVTEPVRKKAA